MSSSPAVLEALSRTCQGGHAHAPLLGGTRARDAAVYPPGLCKAIAQGAAKQLRLDQAPLHAVRGGREPQPTEVHCGEVQGRTKDEDEELAAWSVGEVYDEWSVGEVYDEITGAALPPELVRQARDEEIKIMLG